MNNSSAEPHSQRQLSEPQGENDTVCLVVIYCPIARRILSQRNSDRTVSTQIEQKPPELPPLVLVEFSTR